MDERGWLFFALFTFFAFVGISYVRESKLVFLVEKYSSQLESLQNVTLSIPPEKIANQIIRSPNQAVNERGRSKCPLTSSRCPLIVTFCYFLSKFRTNAAKTTAKAGNFDVSPTFYYLPTLRFLTKILIFDQNCDFNENLN